MDGRWRTSAKETVPIGMAKGKAGVTAGSIDWSLAIDEGAHRKALRAATIERKRDDKRKSRHRNR